MTMGGRDKLRYWTDRPARMIPARPASGALKMAVAIASQNATRQEPVLASGSRMAVVDGGAAGSLFAYAGTGGLLRE